MNILILEDNKIHQRVLKLFFNTLSHLKIKTFIRENGKQGLDFRKSTTEKIDLIFTNVKMPIVDGIKFCNEIRKTDKSTPIILMTANYELYNSLTIQGVNDSIIKPFIFDLISHIIYKYTI